MTITRIFFTRAANWVVLLAACLAPAISNAAFNASDSICKPAGIVVGFFNGVNTDETKAMIVRYSLQMTYGSTAPISGQEIQYEHFYNSTEGVPIDVLETLNLRFAEIDVRLKDKWKLIGDTARGDTSWINKFATTSPALGKQINDAVKNWKNGTVKGFVSWFFDQPATTFGDLTKHKKRLDEYVSQNKKFVFVAHSAGNLFANQAYHYVAQGAYPSVAQVIHVAPASTEVNGPYMLGDQDLIIKGLAAVQSSGSVKSSNWSMLEFPFREPDDAGNTDSLGHGFFEIYFNPNRSGVIETGRARFSSLFEATMSTVDQATSNCPTLNTTFIDNFDGIALDSSKWKVERLNGNLASYSVSGGFLNVNVPGGSCGACGVSDGARFTPITSPLTGNFELTLSAEELGRLSRDTTKPLSDIQLLATGSGSQLGIFIVGDVTDNRGVPGHSIVAYYASGASVSYLSIKNLQIGQYYSVQLRIRRISGLSYIAYKVDQDATWMETAIPGSFFATAVLFPSIVIASGDGGGTVVNSVFDARIGSLVIGQ